MSRTRFPLVAAVAVVVAAAIAVLVATSGASTTKPQSTVAAASAISVKQTSLGPTLVDANGRTLYLFEARQAQCQHPVGGRPGHLASVHGHHHTASAERRGGRTDRDGRAGGRRRPGHLQRTPAVLLRRRSQPGSDERPGAEPVRRPVVRPGTRRQRGHLLLHHTRARERVRLVQLRILSAHLTAARRRAPSFKPGLGAGRSVEVSPAVG